MSNLFRLLPAFLLLSTASVAVAQPTPQTKEDIRAARLAGDAITHHAPLVFIGRPVLSTLHVDAAGLIYDGTYIEVIQVLRGGRLPNKVELLDTLPASQYRAPGSYIRQMARKGTPQRIAPGVVGIYFTQAPDSVLATPLQAFPQRPTQLQSYKHLREAKILVEPMSLFGILGLFQHWDTTKEVQRYLAQVPRLLPVPDSVFQETKTARTQ